MTLNALAASSSLPNRRIFHPFLPISRPCVEVHYRPERQINIRVLPNGSNEFFLGLRMKYRLHALQILRAREKTTETGIPRTFPERSSLILLRAIAPQAASTLGSMPLRDSMMASAIMTGATGTNDFKGNMQKAVQQGGWVAFLTHGFQGKNNGSATYSPTPIGSIEDGLKWAQQNDKDIWVAPMGHVAMYIKERKASQVSASTSGSTTTVKLTHNIKDNISDYDYPLTLKVKTSLSKAEVTQAGAKLEAKIEGGYAIFDAVPNAGDIVIAGEGAGPESSSSSETTSSSSSGAVDCTANPTDASCQGMAIASELQNNFNLSVYRSSDNYIVVGGAQGMNITVFNSLGHQVRTTRGLGAVQKVYTGAKGVYLVKVGSKTFKVKL